MADGERLERVMALLEEVRDLPAHRRAAFLDRACGDDRDLRAELESLLEADAGDSRFMKEPLIGPPDRTDPWIGRTLGNYRLIEVLAAGGMGVVYRAQQEHPRRPVAVKLIRSGAVSAQLLRRFELEADVLGRLDHPGIAQIFEASTVETDTGPQPFFAMELIDGPPLNRHAEDRDLRTEERLHLLVKVCDAVNHAHRRGVIHRDLKPANILVREDGQPKVLDFGVARITDADLQATTMHTDLGQIIGTLAYMSPEQVRGHHEELDIRSDVYSLGVLGYELLTGRLPQKLAGKSISEAARIIEHENPSTLGASGGAFAPDLETIIGKCLEKEKSRRYGSAAELAADLRRFLNHEPIAARPPSLGYQFRRFARRNRGLVALAGLALAALVAGLAISLAGWNSAANARTRAETEAEKAKLLNAYLSEMLEAPDPWVDGREVKVVEILDQASRELEQSLGGQPEVAAQAHHRLGFTYYSLGLYEEAEPHLARALEISADVGDVPVDARVMMLTDMGALKIDTGELEEAERWAREAFELAERSLDPADPIRNTATHNLALALWYKGDVDEAARLMEICLEHSSPDEGVQESDRIATMSSLGNIYRQQGRIEEARPLLEKAYAWNRDHFGDDHPQTAISLNNLAFGYQELAQHDLALEMFRRSLDSRRRVHGDRSQSVIIGLHNLGMQLSLMDRDAEALPLFEEANVAAEAVLDDAHWLKPWIHSTYGRTLAKLGRHAEAERELLASLDGVRAVLGGDHWRTRKLCGYVAAFYDATGDDGRAAEYLALAGEDHPTPAAS